MSYGAVPPPESLSGASSNRGRGPLDKRFDQQKQQQYIALTQGYRGATSSADSRKRNIDGDDYFDDDSDEDEKKSHSRRDFDKNGSPTKKSRRSPEQGKEQEEEEEDELDSFMASVDAQAKKDIGLSAKKEQDVMENPTESTAEGGQKGRDDIDEEDMQESYFKFLEEYNARHEEEDEVYEYDEDGNIIWTWKKVIDPLPKIDHATIQYKPFTRDVYEEHDDIRKTNAREIFELRSKLDIRVFGSDPPKPVESFAHFSFDKTLMNQIRRNAFEKPTPIQAQAIPAALKGRDVLGLAKTGSGKTLAYVLPAIVHIMEQEELSVGDGPIAVVVVPTRELAIQVYQHSVSYCKPYNINIVCAYGGGNKHEQQRALEEGAELVICTPGRIIDLVKGEATNFLRTTFLVFDEVDRMFDLGFEAQVKSIADQIRPDRQCLMFSATMKKKVEKLAVHALDNPIKIVCGDVGEVNSDVHQTVCVVANLQEKYNWIYRHLVQFCTMGKLLIFVTKKVDAEDVAKKLKLRDARLVLLHGDMMQQERNEQISAFRTTASVMVATDVAARGLDIPEIRNVVNFDVARDLDTHVHRVGRTGRAGQQGFAYTLVTDADKEFCGHLVKNLEAGGQGVPPELLSLALKSTWFKRQHDQQQPSEYGGSNVGGVNRRLGLGYRPKIRPGYGEGAPTPHEPQTSSYLTQSSGPSVARVVEKAKSFINSSNDSGTMSKGEMMRSALKNTFQNTFHRASTNEWEESRPAASDPVPEWKRKLEQRVANINKVVQLQGAKGHEEPSNADHDGTTPPRRASRWQK